MDDEIIMPDADRDVPLLRIKSSQHSNVPLTPLYSNSDPLNWVASHPSSTQGGQGSLPYVIHLTSIENSVVAAFSSPSDSFSCFDPTTLAITHHPQTFTGHPGGITKVKRDRQQASIFWSSGIDGRVRCHDLRQPTPHTGPFILFQSNNYPKEVTKDGFKEVSIRLGHC